MTLQWIPLDALEAHPENSNRMPVRLMEKLKGHIRRTGLYEPLVVRPLPLPMADRGKAEGSPAAAEANPIRDPQGRYQILNGHHRAQVLRQLGHSHARCDVWEVDDAEARLLLATLNRLEGRDDPSARARLVAELARSRPPEDLAQLLPEPADAVERLLALARPPAAPLPAELAEPLLRPMTFFLTDEQHVLVGEALGEVAKRGTRNAERETEKEQPLATRPSLPAPRSSLRVPRLGRSETLERLALWYLESLNLR
jgi:hypothetical protein